MRARRVFCYIALILILAGCAKTTPVAITDDPQQIIGDDIDEQGCISTAGYQWCESLDECIRDWETDCPVSTSTVRPTLLPTPFATSEPSPTPIPKRYTAILLGEDRSGTGTGPRTDVFIILTYVPERKDLLVISVPRDLYVEYGGQAEIFCDPPSEHDRINRAYALGSFDCVDAIVEHTFGLVANSGIALVGFHDFVELVDQMGCLTIQPGRSYTDWCGSLGGDPGFWATWNAGSSYLMSGEVLLCYVRARMQSSDLDRNRRAQEVLLAMKKQWLDESPLEALYSLIPFVWERVKVDLSLDGVVGMIELAKANVLEDWDIRSVILRYNQEVAFHTTENGASVLHPLVDFRGWTACLLDGRSSETCARLNPLEETE